MGTRKVTGVDARIGATIWKHRIMHGMERRELGAAIGVTHNQICKYERGVDSISLGMLRLIAHTLNVPMTDLFKGVEGGLTEPVRQRTLLNFLQHAMSIPDCWFEEFCALVASMVPVPTDTTIMETEEVSATRSVATELELV